MKAILIALTLLLALLQYELWFSPGGLTSVWHLKKQIIEQQRYNQKLKAQNNELIADLRDLKSGNESIEERARNDLGMMKKGEKFYQVTSVKRS